MDIPGLFQRMEWFKIGRSHKEERVRKTFTITPNLILPQGFVLLVFSVHLNLRDIIYNNNNNILTEISQVKFEENKIYTDLITTTS